MALFRTRAPLMVTVVPEEGPAPEAVAGGPAPAQPPPAGVTVQVESVQQAAGASDEKARASWLEVTIGFAAFGVCLFLAVEVWDTKSDVEFTPVDGITSLALFYVIAVAIERLLEFVGSPIEYVLALGREVEAPSSAQGLKKVAAKTKPGLKVARDANVTAAIATPTAENANDAAKGQANVDKATKGRSAALAGIAGGIGVLAADYFNADFLGVLGVTGFEAGLGDYVRLGVTGLVVAGGSKQLHDLITNISKKAEEKDTPEETSTAS